MISVQCGCGKALKAGDDKVGQNIRCPECGASVLVPWPEDEPVAITEESAAPAAKKSQGVAKTGKPPAKPTRRPKIECPDCGSDNWQRAEAAYDAGTSHHTGTTIIVTGGGIGAAETSGRSQSRLAAKVAPPPARSTTGPGIYLVLGILAVFVGAVLMAEYGQNVRDRDQVVFGAILLFAGLVVACLAIFALAKVSKYNSTILLGLMAEWRRLFVCLKCGHAWYEDDLP